ncbi:MAG TPA: efflux RND transporter periplasmic adaptor subunit [Anaeromyxobacter sp.]|nr:efflux RND transporter periplasmic adaptor subunit [Anaeromyxobacter sp.]
MPRRLALLSAVLATLSCGDRARAPAPAGAPSPGAAAPTAPPPARLVEPERVRHASRTTVTGTLKARQSAPLAMSVPGTLLRVPVRRGEEVREGALLASLDDAAAAAARKQAQAAVAAAKAQLALADDALARAKRIRDEEGVSEAQLFEARARRDGAAAGLAAAEAQLEQATVQLAHHHLHAPFAGVVTRVPDGVGITVAPGVPVVSLASTRQLVLDTTLTQAEAAEVRPGAKAIVTVPATGARIADATVQVVVPAVDPDTNRVPIEIAVPNADGRFLPNAFARAELAGAGERDAWRVPSAALVERAGGHAVWVAAADGKARALPVRLLAEERDAAIVRPEEGSWPAGLKVVEAPPLGIVEGTAVAEAGR